MKTVGFLAGLLLLALVQVTVAPLFPLRAAIPDLVLVGVMALALYKGPQQAMLAVPILALLVGLGSNRAPGLVLVAYLPVLPLAFFIEDRRMPGTRYVQAATATVAGGIAARFILALGPMTQGADFTISALTKDLLLPGVLLDWALLTVAYAPLRIVGWEASRMTLSRSSY